MLEWRVYFFLQKRKKTLYPLHSRLRKLLRNFPAPGALSRDPRSKQKNLSKNIKCNTSCCCSGAWGEPGVRMPGSTNIEVGAKAEARAGDRASGGNATAAARVVNAIRQVCEAEPGLLDALSVPLLPVRGSLV